MNKIKNNLEDSISVHDALLNIQITENKTKISISVPKKINIIANWRTHCKSYDFFFFNFME